MDKQTMTTAKDEETKKTVRYYWGVGQKVYHPVLEGSRLTMCGARVKMGPWWNLTAFRPKGHRICYKCLYARE